MSISNLIVENCSKNFPSKINFLNKYISQNGKKNPCPNKTISCKGN